MNPLNTLPAVLRGPTRRTVCAIALALLAWSAFLVQCASGAQLPAGTVAYYTFSASGKDTSGKGNDLHATSGAPQFNSSGGPFAGALHLDGSTTLGTVSGSFPVGVPTGSNAYTVACFVEADPTSSGNGGWIGYGSPAYKQCNNFRMAGYTGVWNYWWNADNGGTLPNGADFSSGWHSVVGTWDGTTRNLYVDGILLATDEPGPPAITSVSFVVGKTLGDANLTGSIAELLIANRALSFQEVLAYNAYGGMAPAPLATSLLLVASTNQSTEGGSITFTATVETNGVAASGLTGSVAFQDGGMPFATVDLASGRAVLSTRGLAAGSHQITAEYLGDANTAASTSSVVNVTVAAAQVGLPAGTVAYYKFHGSGVDASPYGNDLQATIGAPQFLSSGGPFGGALYLDGGSTLGTLSGSFPAGVPIGGNPYTVACFVKADPASSPSGGWIGYGSTGTRSCNNFRMNGYAGIQNYWWNADINAALPGDGDFTNGWHSVVGTWDGTTRNIYIDGLLQASDTPGAPAFTSANFVIGKTLGDANLTGWLAELFIANRSLAPAEVRTYNRYGVAGISTNAMATGTRLVSSASLSTEGSNVTFTVTVLTNGAAAIDAVGWAVFKDGVASLGAVVVSSGQAVLNTRGLAAGAHSITAVYNGDAKYNASTSSVVNLIITAAQTGLPAGTVAYYKFHGSAADSSIYGNDLQAATGTPQFLASGGPFGGVLYLDGASTLGTVSGSFPVGVPTGSNAYTVACFVQADPSSSLTGGWIGYGSTANGECNNFRMNGYTGVWNYWWNADTGATVPNGGDFTTAWHSVVGTWDGYTRHIYIDGVLEESDTPAPPAITSANFVVGKTLGDANFTGSLAELLIANRPLSFQEVQAYSTYGGISPAPRATSTLIAASTNLSSEGAAITITATIQTNGVTATGLSGSVLFQDGATSVGMVAVTNGQAVLFTRGLAAGSHQITAEYLGDANDAASGSSVVNITVAAARLGLPPGTVAYYPFNGSIADSSPYGNDLQATAGSPQFLTTGGPFGGALYLDGSTLLGTVSGSFPVGVPTGAEPYTVACFVKADPGSGGNGGWLGYGVNGSKGLANNFRMADFTGVQNYWWNEDLNALFPGDGNFTTAWHSVVGTWDGATRKIYLDGNLQSYDTPSPPPDFGTASFVVGKTLNDANLTGWLAELLIANRAFSPAEVQSYNEYGGISPNLSYVTHPGQVTISWPGGYLGWILQGQTNALNRGLSTNWVDMPATARVTSTNVLISPQDAAVFYRLRHP